MDGQCMCCGITTNERTVVGYSRICGYCVHIVKRVDILPDGIIRVTFTSGAYREFRRED